MARRKNSTALFEVITTRKAEPSKPLGKPRFKLSSWLAGRDPAPASPALQGAGATQGAPAPISRDPSDPTANVTAAMLHSRDAAQPAQSTAMVPYVAPADPAAYAAPASDEHQQRLADDLAIGRPQREMETEPEPPIHAAARSAGRDLDRNEQWTDPAGPEIGRGGVGVRFDGDRREVTFKFRYTSAILTGVAVLVIVGMAYIFGRSAGGPAPVSAQQPEPSSEQVRRNPPQTNVLDLGNRAPRATMTANGQPVPPTPAPAPPPAADLPYVDATVAPDGSVRRTMNMNYFVVQTFSPEHHQTAVEVCAYLTRNGIPCTIEQGLPRVTADPKWYCVVGARGFQPRYSTLREYQLYERTIAMLVGKYPDKTVFTRFAPIMYKWTQN